MSCDIGQVTERLENELRSFLQPFHCSFSNLSVSSPMSQFILILQAFCHFTYVTVHSDSPSFLSLHLRHSSFPNPSLALPMSQLILQPFHCFTYVTAHSPTLFSLLQRHRIFTYITWQAAHVLQPFFCFSYVISSSLNSPGEPMVQDRINLLELSFLTSG